MITENTKTNSIESLIEPSSSFFKFYSSPEPIQISDLLKIENIKDYPPVDYSEALHAFKFWTGLNNPQISGVAKISEVSYYPHVVNRSGPSYKDTRFPPSSMSVLLNLSKKININNEEKSVGRIGLAFYDSETGKMILRKINPQFDNFFETQNYLTGLGKNNDLSKYLDGILKDRKNYLFPELGIGNSLKTEIKKNTKLKNRLSKICDLLKITPIYLIRKASSNETYLYSNLIIEHQERLYSGKEEAINS